jgi:hypothetical protein
MSRTTIAALAAALLAGCGPGLPETSEIRGRVTIDGRPVTAGRVVFLAADDSNSAAADLAADGTYIALAAPAGDVKVAVQVQHARLAPARGAPPPAPADGGGDSAGHVPAEYAGGMKPNPLYVPVPARYESTETSGLTASVRPRRHTHDIELSSR